MSFHPSHVLASTGTQCTDNKDKISANRENLSVPKLREIQVWATGEAVLTPDRASVRIVVSSKKEQAGEAKSSVARRLDYIVQTLHTHNVKEGDVTITKFIQRLEGVYNMEAEVGVVFVDFDKCQAVCNFLVEKLDESVLVSQPNYFHSSHGLEGVRRQACLNAVQNARQKALEVARLLRQGLGRPLTIREDQSHEWEGPTPSQQDSAAGNEGPMTLQQKIANATVTVSAKVFASFELVSRDKSKQQQRT
ncbi:interleukin-1 receptor-associated kinase 1-binding protein 1-like [Amphiura filiformis]|uniref:interleukin-1 receptor-associated kinase 1-binding protein 1-like n=1 Tax=Amphiura filiformis TaxID=82378 RepID=UPI003B20DCCE